MLKTVKTYENGYAIVKNDIPNGLFFCQKSKQNLVQKNGKIASFKTIEQAETFMKNAGVEEKQAATPAVQPIAEVLPLQEQLARISNNDRFAVVEVAKSYGNGPEILYGIVDRENDNDYTSPMVDVREPHRPMKNGLYIKREDAEADAHTLNTNPSRIPPSIEYDESLLKALVRGNLEDMGSNVPAELKPEQPKRDMFKPAAKKTVTFDGQYTPGEIITDSRTNAKYRAIESFYISEQDADFAADDGVYLTPGWHTKAELI